MSASITDLSQEKKSFSITCKRKYKIDNNFFFKKREVTDMIVPNNLFRNHNNQFKVVETLKLS